MNRAKVTNNASVNINNFAGQINHHSDGVLVRAVGVSFELAIVADDERVDGLGLEQLITSQVRYRVDLKYEIPLD